jgi:hypothetical protein
MTLLKPVCLLVTLQVAFAWQLPGLVPRNYQKGQMLDIFVG